MTENPVLIVTGASKGLGAGIARQAARLGASLALAARSQQLLVELAEEISKSGGRAMAVPADVGKEEDLHMIIEETLKHFGRIDALVNNAGLVEPIAHISESDMTAWKRLWEVNVTGVVSLTQVALPSLRAAHGRVINITSGAAETVVAGWGAYSSSKAAINQFSRVLASEEPDITVLGVLPGIVDTDMQAVIRVKGKDHMAERNYNWLAGLHDRGELLQPDMPGEAIACLALFAPQDWSGEILIWNDPRIQQLIDLHSTP